MREVVIGGIGALSAAGQGVAALLDSLRKNSSCLRAVDEFRSPRFQSNIVGAALSERGEDPAWSLANQALAESREAAAEILQNIPAERVGLVLSTTKANIVALERLQENRPCSASARRHLQADLLAGDLAAAHAARGPVQCISLACVSGLVALAQGAHLIRRGQADAVHVVGVDSLSEFVLAGFTALKALDPAGCRPFDRERCGLSAGEAGAAIVLVDKKFAPSASIRIAGFGGSNDANHLTGPSRDGSGLAQAIRAALDSAQLSPAQIDYVHAHGTGTAYNDAMESLALKTVFGAECPPVSGSKGMFGHTLGAAGVIETICGVLALREQFMPGTPRLSVPADGVPARLVREPKAAPLKNILKLNTGFGGIN
ncbi:MAG TPA: beta-ketoacyl-[acyl-carrier-protein] synthase family protein, partial [Thermomicrobiales bacterium]|nr:beta-ketoacyl-[acyl-carrier-protein] synthase family protein [Thermomicrobiales bacterium]